MNPPTPGLRPPPVTLRYDANRPSKTTVHVPPGDELQVSEDVAAQLEQADDHFRRVGQEQDEDTCAGTTAAGDPCSNPARDDGFCWRHGDA